MLNRRRVEPSTVAGNSVPYRLMKRSCLSASIDPPGYDAGKKIKGKKRHILVDTTGLLMHGIVHATDIQDRDGGGLVMTALFGLAATQDSTSEWRELGAQVRCLPAVAFLTHIGEPASGNRWSATTLQRLMVLLGLGVERLRNGDEPVPQLGRSLECWMRIKHMSPARISLLVSLLVLISVQAKSEPFVFDNQREFPAYQPCPAGWFQVSQRTEPSQGRPLFRIYSTCIQLVPLGSESLITSQQNTINTLRAQVSQLQSNVSSLSTSIDALTKRLDSLTPK
jgi:hypothetical protein